jgi:hypothetical protein
MNIFSNVLEFFHIFTLYSILTEYFAGRWCKYQSSEFSRLPVFSIVQRWKATETVLKQAELLAEDLMS